MTNTAPKHCRQRLRAPQYFAALSLRLRAQPSRQLRSATVLVRRAWTLGGYALMKTLTHSIHRIELLLMAACCLFAAFNPVFAQTWTQTTAPIPNLYWQSIVASANGGQVVGVVSTAPFVIANIGASGYRCYRAFNLFTATVK